MTFEIIPRRFFFLTIIRSSFRGAINLLKKNFKIDFIFFSDDPSFWGALPLSHDFYLAFLGIMSAKQDLRAIKKVILNSFDYSSLTSVEKAHAIAIWNEQWQKFIKNSLRNHKTTILVQN
jgi:hypothetical protein